MPENKNKLSADKIKELLVAQSYVTKADITKAEKYAQEGRGTIIDYLFIAGLLTKDLYGQALAEYYKVPYADLNTNQPGKDQALRIPEELAIANHIVLFEDNDKSAVITTDNPTNTSWLEEVKGILKGKKISIALSLTEDIETVFSYYKKSLDVRFEKILETQKRAAPEIIEVIFKDAITYRASDIHFEPLSDKVLVRFRVDGILNGAGSLPKDTYTNILNRIKVLSNMRIDEHFAAQDGAIRFETPEYTLDMRVSIIPTMEGEKIVIRLLSHYVHAFSLSDLGLRDTHRDIINASAKKPFGMILVAGPTGSGKTTTLYALLKILNTPEVNITTIEDPVEYRMTGVNQIQVNHQTNLTFAKGLRSIVRQDPDVILVGEIRDTETAEISVNAALTGHLLLSTFHANDAASAIPRLLDMGVEPFLLASTLDIIIAQRLVRKICDHCRSTIEVSAKNINHYFAGADKYFNLDKNIIYQGKGCELCNHTGYKGRTAIYEIIDITPEMEDLILKHPSSKELWELAQSQGTLSLFEDGVQKVKEGVTTLEELLRVAEPPKN